MAERFSVFVADDHPLVLSAIVAAIKGTPELELIGQAADGRAALDAIRAAPPDVSVLDMRMPELDGRQVLHAVVRDEIETRVLFLAADSDPAAAYDSLAAGAAGYVDKSASPEEVGRAILAVARGSTYVGKGLESQVLGEIAARGATKRPELSKRELEVLRLVAQGCSAREAGARLYVEESTVKSHLKSIYEKLGVTTRAAAIAEGMRRGLLE